MDPKSRSKGTFAVAFSAICAALTVTVVAAGYALKLFDMSAVVVCGLITAVLCRECGVKYAALAAVVSTVLIGIFLPDLTLAVLYFSAGGVYPLIRRWFNGYPAGPRWLLKVLTAELMSGAYIAAIFLFVPSEAGKYLIPVGLAGGLVVFLLYDVLLSRFEIIYDERLRRKLNFK